MPLAGTEPASQPNRQHDKIAAPINLYSKRKVSSSNTTINAFLKQVTLQLTRGKWRKSVTVKLHADHSAADGNRAVTSEVNRPAISPIVTVAAARRPPAGKVGSPKTPRRAKNYS